MSDSIVSVRRKINQVLEKNCVTCEQAEWALKRLIDEDPELKREMTKLLELREGTIEKLKSVFTCLCKWQRGINIIKLIGTVINIFGGVVTLTGLALVPLSCGSLLIVSIVEAAFSGHSW